MRAALGVATIAAARFLSTSRSPAHHHGAAHSANFLPLWLDRDPSAPLGADEISYDRIKASLFQPVTAIGRRLGGMARTLLHGGSTRGRRRRGCGGRRGCRVSLPSSTLGARSRHLALSCEASFLFLASFTNAGT
jgi:hypothetical protein